MTDDPSTSPIHSDPCPNWPGCPDRSHIRGHIQSSDIATKSIGYKKKAYSYKKRLTQIVLML